MTRATRLLVLGIAALGIFAPGAEARTVVSLTFDDERATQAHAADVLNAHDLDGTFYIISGKAGTSSYYLNWDQINALARAGHEIGGHTLSHPDLSKLSSAEQRREICDDRTALQARGYDVESFAYPYGNYNRAAVRNVRACGYTTARRVGGVVSPGWCPSCDSPFAESLLPADPLVTRTPAAGGELTLAYMQNAVTTAEKHGGGWVQIVFHEICPNSCDSGSVSPSAFEEFVSWVAARRGKGTIVRTVRDSIRQAPRPRVRPRRPRGSDVPRTVRLGLSGLADGSKAVLDLKTPAGKRALHRTVRGTGRTLVVSWRVPAGLAAQIRRQGRVTLTGTLDLGSAGLTFTVRVKVRPASLTR
jgi:hypothetical protein